MFFDQNVTKRWQCHRLWTHFVTPETHSSTCNCVDHFWEGRIRFWSRVVSEEAMVKKCFDVGLLPQVKGSKLLYHVCRVLQGAAGCAFLELLRNPDVCALLVYILSSSVHSLGVSVHCSSARERSLKTLSEREKNPELSIRFLWRQCYKENYELTMTSHNQNHLASKVEKEGDV